MSEQQLDDAVEVGHETRDAEAGPLLQFAISLAVLTGFIAVMVVGIYKYFDAREIAEKATKYPLAVGQPVVEPPPPRLQTYPFDDVKALHREEARYLNHYAWVDKNAGVVRIPVERAIDILAERGLPHREAPAAAGDAAAPTAPAMDTDKH
jgi:hypothetical protein